NETQVTEFIFLAFAKSSRYPSLLFTIILFLYLFIICGNTIMLLTIRYDSRLHVPMYFFVAVLSCMDICYLTCIVPQTLCNLLSKTASISFGRCVTQMFLFNVFGLVQITIVTIMAYDRYVAIGHPLHYKTMMDQETCIKFLALSLIAGCITATIIGYFIFRLPFCRTPEIDHFYCDMGQIMLLTCHHHRQYKVTEATTFLLGIGIFTIPLIILVVNYVYIINAVLKIRTNEGRRKAFSTCSSHLTVVIVEYGCLGFMYFRPAETYYMDKDRVFVMTFTFLTPILNPVVYTVRNKAVKEGFKKLISKK
ncbi:hypothetical protein GDO78_001987, partial [Eleutherodactylus coqui]